MAAQTSFLFTTILSWALRAGRAGRGGLFFSPERPFGKSFAVGMRPGRVSADAGSLRPLLGWSENSTGAPPLCNDADEASKILTSSVPRVPQLTGVVPVRMQLRKCWHSVLSGSSCLIYGAYMSP